MAGLLAAGPLLAKSPEAKPDLPRTAPLPEVQREAEPVAPAKPPVPEERPADAPKPDGKDGSTPEEPAQPQPPQTAPKPPEKPKDAPKAGNPADGEKPDEPAGAEKDKPAGADKPAADADKEKPALDEKEPPAPPKRPLDPRVDIVPQDKLPAEEVACRQRLQALGAEFENRKAEHDGDVGCSIPYPLMLKKLTRTIDIAPEAELNCSMAEAAAKFMTEVASPAAKTQLGSEIKSINQASAYVCRPRHNGQKISEHAFGNALDIARFTLADGTEVDVKPAPPEKQEKFLQTVRKAACGPFKTVLGPGSDPDHALHLHFDLEPRRNGGTFCQ